MMIDEIQEEIDEAKSKGMHVGSLSDGYHSFDDLYDHREALTAALFNRLPFTWKARIHEDGSMFDGMFIVGCATPYGMITYHYDNEFWADFKVPVLTHAPVFDGHTPEDMVDRIRKYLCKGRVPLTEEEDEHLRDAIQLIIDTYGNDDAGIKMYIGAFSN